MTAAAAAGAPPPEPACLPVKKALAIPDTWTARDRRKRETALANVEDNERDAADRRVRKRAASEVLQEMRSARMSRSTAF